MRRLAAGRTGLPPAGTWCRCRHVEAPAAAAAAERCLSHASGRRYRRTQRADPSGSTLRSSPVDLLHARAPALRSGSSASSVRPVRTVPASNSIDASVQASLSIFTSVGENAGERALPLFSLSMRALQIGGQPRFIDAEVPQDRRDVVVARLERLEQVVLDFNVVVGTRDTQTGRCLRACSGWCRSVWRSAISDSGSCDRLPRLVSLPSFFVVIRQRICFYTANATADPYGMTTKSSCIFETQCLMPARTPRHPGSPKRAVWSSTSSPVPAAIPPPFAAPGRTAERVSLLQNQLHLSLVLLRRNKYLTQASDRRYAPGPGKKAAILLRKSSGPMRDADPAMMLPDLVSHHRTSAQLLTGPVLSAEDRAVFWRQRSPCSRELLDCNWNIEVIFENLFQRCSRLTWYVPSQQARSRPSRRGHRELLPSAPAGPSVPSPRKSNNPR